MDGAILCDINLWITRSKKFHLPPMFYDVRTIIGYELFLRFVPPPNVLVSARWEVRISTKEAKSWSLFCAKRRKEWAHVTFCLLLCFSRYFVFSIQSLQPEKKKK